MARPWARRQKAKPSATPSSSSSSLATPETNNHGTSDTAGTMPASSVQDQLEAVLRLMQARASGQVTSEEVEAAVDGMLQSVGAVPPQPPATTTTNNTDRADVTIRAATAVSKKPLIEEDNENYDEEEEEQKKDGEALSEEKIESADTAGQLPSSSERNPTIPQKRKRGRPSSKPTLPLLNPTLYEDIPLGLQGAQMLLTFGDGRGGPPRPETVRAVLLGARRKLQAAIQDARVLRRKQRQIFHAAQRTMSKNNTSQQKSQPSQRISMLLSSATPKMMYGAYEGHNSLSRKQNAGFEVDQLQQLFPEEMNAYRKWNEMHAEMEEKRAAENEEKEAAEAAAATKKGGKGTETSTTKRENDDESPGKKVASDDKTKNNNSNDTDDKTKDINDEDDVGVGGHLKARLAQFDVRTVRMKEDWYMKFADLRQGSFLPRKEASRAEAAAWDVSREDRRTEGSNGAAAAAGDGASGGGSAASWGQMNLGAVRFLHWVGFDPQSALPPPNDDTTQALAFLAYDFFGRIVEKSIFLRNLEKQRQRGEPVDETAIVLELEPGEQLEERDIQRAMEDPDIRPSPLFSSATFSQSSNNNDSSKPTIGPQLYFGPGFEERLEMELDELLATEQNESLSPEELKIRQEEDALFSRLAAPPEMGRVSSLLGMEQQQSEVSGASGNNPGERIPVKSKKVREE